MLQRGLRQTFCSSACNQPHMGQRKEGFFCDASGSFSCVNRRRWESVTVQRAINNSIKIMVTVAANM